MKANTNSFRMKENAEYILAKWTPPLLEQEAPLYAKKAKGCFIWDIDDNKYLDFLMSYGAVILGYADDIVNHAITQQLEIGSIYSIDNQCRIELAELIKEWFPAAEKFIFLKTGSEATQAAVRIARYTTGKNIILHYGYHGWYDWCSFNNGVPDNTYINLLSFDYNHFEQIEKNFKEHKGNIAAIILQPGGDHKKPVKGFLQNIREICDNNDTCLIFDEVRTGMRMGKGGSQEYFKVRPDLTCISKGLGNGLPISSLFGKNVYMNNAFKAEIEGTYHRDVLAITAAITTIKEINKRNTFEHIWHVGNYLLSEMQNIFNRYRELEISVTGFPPMPKIKFSGKDIINKNIVYSSLFKAGIIFPPNHHLFLTGAHTKEDIDSVLNRIDTICRNISSRM